MASTGRAFLNTQGRSTLTIDQAALDAVRAYTGFGLTRGLALVLFRHGRRLRPEDVAAMGLPARYRGRTAGGERTWYFRFRIFGEELVAVVGEGDRRGEYLWLATRAVHAPVYSPRRAAARAAAPA